MLNEAKLTIIKLQKDINSLKSHIETLQQQNDNYSLELKAIKNPELQTNQSEHNKNCSRLSQTDNHVSPPIPLEPVVIVNSNSRTKNAVKKKSIQRKMRDLNSSTTSDDSQSLTDDRNSESDNTFNG